MDMPEVCQMGQPHRWGAHWYALWFSWFLKFSKRGRRLLERYWFTCELHGGQWLRHLGSGPLLWALPDQQGVACACKQNAGRGCTLRTHWQSHTWSQLPLPDCRCAAPKEQFGGENQNRREENRGFFKWPHPQGSDSILKFISCSNIFSGYKGQYRKEYAS